MTEVMCNYTICPYEKDGKCIAESIRMSCERLEGDKYPTCLTGNSSS